MADDYKTTEARAFREHYDKLVDSIQEADLPLLGARFFSRHVISKDTMEMVGNTATARAVRASKLMLAVMAHLETSPGRFESVLDVFKSEQVYTELSSAISGSYGALISSSPVAPVLPPVIETAIQKYAAHTRHVYLRSKLPVKGKWPPSPCKKIIKLATIEKLNTVGVHQSDSVDEYMQKNPMNPISMEELLVTKDGSPLSTVVVQGVPGIGKSTFAWKFCRQWAKGKIYQQFDLVLLLRMRDTRVQEAKKLCELFSPFLEEERKQIEKEAIACSGKGMVFVVEGLDEFPAILKGDSLLAEIFEGILLPKLTVLVTSRPWAVQELIRKCGHQISRQVEILGFTKDHILRYVSHAFSDKDKVAFLEYLNSHPQLESIMHIPLNSAFVVQIYKQFKRTQQAIPHTLTQLYTALVKGLLVRYVESVPEFCGMKIADLSSIPEPIKTHFQQLCLLAFMSFTKLTAQVVFTDEEAALYGCLDSLGLMQSTAELSVIDAGTTVTHSFIHFTVQEYMAAFHLSQRPCQIQETFVLVHQKDLQFSNIIRFLIGLNSKVLKYIDIDRSRSLRSMQLHWLFESQSPPDVAACLGVERLEYRSPAVEDTPFDLHALTFCLCHSNCAWDIMIQPSQLKSLALTESSEQFTSYINCLALIDYWSSGIRVLMDLPSRLFSNLTTLFVCCHSIEEDASVAQLFCTELLSSVKQLYVRGSLFSARNVDLGVFSKLLHSSANLTLISCCDGNFAYPDMLPLCSYISTSTSLKGLALRGIAFLENSLPLLISAIPCAKSLTELDLSCNEWSVSDIEMLSVSLMEPSTLETLKLEACHLDGEMTAILASGLEDNQCIIELSLCCNNIDVHGAAALSSMLTVNTTLRRLHLNTLNEGIGINGAIKLINALDSNKHLEKLTLPSLIEPIEFKSVLMTEVRESQRVLFY